MHPADLNKDARLGTPAGAAEVGAVAAAPPPPRRELSARIATALWMPATRAQPHRHQRAAPSHKQPDQKWTGCKPGQAATREAPATLRRLRPLPSDSRSKPAHLHSNNNSSPPARQQQQQQQPTCATTTATATHLCSKSNSNSSSSPPARPPSTPPPAAPWSGGSAAEQAGGQMGTNVVAGKHLTDAVQ